MITVDGPFTTGLKMRPVTCKLTNLCVRAFKQGRLGSSQAVQKTVEHDVFVKKWLRHTQDQLMSSKTNFSVQAIAVVSGTYRILLMKSLYLKHEKNDDFSSISAISTGWRMVEVSDVKDEKWTNTK